jgi:RHS repeat-associated protein
VFVYSDAEWRECEDPNTGTERWLDKLNRRISADFALNGTSDQTIAYTYDEGTYGIGRLTGVSDSAHSMSWSYDAQGRVTNTTQVLSGVSQSAAYGYTDGQLTSIVIPSGQTITYTYVNGRVDQIRVNGTTVLSGVIYEPFGPVRQWTWGNGTLAVRNYDQDGKVEQIDSAGLNSFAYDDAFRITGITDADNSALSWQYGYDPLDRLTSASKTGASYSWSYDFNGNRSGQTGTEAVTYTRSAVSNRILSVSGALTRTYTYDAAGNTTGDGTRTFAYDYQGRMKSSTSGGATVSFVYNALGQRIKRGGTVTRVFFYDQAGHLQGEYTAARSLVQETVWLGDIPVATLRSKSGGGVDIFYVHTDHLNTPRKVSQPSDNKLRWRWDSTPFGTGVPNENPEGVGTFAYNLRFPGQYFDTETGLHYNYFRDFDPNTGRYVQSDPIGLLGGVNTYGYVLQNPISLSDPLGLDGFYCRRPLGKPPGTKGPPILHHEYICVTRADGSIQCGGQTPSGNPIKSPGRPTTPMEDYLDEKSCKKVDDDKDRCYEKCVQSNLKKPRPTYGIGPQGTDCQEFAEDLNLSCKLICGNRGKLRESLFPGEE